MSKATVGAVNTDIAGIFGIVAAPLIKRSEEWRPEGGQIDERSRRTACSPLNSPDRSHSSKA